MNDTPLPNPAPVASESVADAVAALEKQVHYLLVIVILLVAVLDIYMLRQWVTMRKDVVAIQPQYSQIKENFDRALPGMNAFLKQLTDYAKTHRDFQPILAKYPIQYTPAPTNAAPAVAQPAKAASPAPAKAPAPAPKK
jgi:cell division protein FtsL